jgi:hypothetical protein
MPDLWPGHGLGRAPTSGPAEEWESMSAMVFHLLHSSHAGKNRTPHDQNPLQGSMTEPIEFPERLDTGSGRLGSLHIGAGAAGRGWQLQPDPCGGPGPRETWL